MAALRDVDQADLPLDAHALTARIRSGVSATRSALSALVETEAVLAIVDRYDDGLHGPATRPLIVDPQNVALNRTQLAYALRGSVTVGRQRIERARRAAVWRRDRPARHRAAGRALYAARYPRYRADGFGADTDKLWLSIDWSL